MKTTIMAIAAVAAFSTSASAFDFDFWNTDSSNFVAVDRYGYPVKDNGIFAFNGNEFTNPKWYAQEFINMVDEFDKEFDNDTYRKFTNSYYAPGYPTAHNHHFPAEAK